MEELSIGFSVGIEHGKELVSDLLFDTLRHIPQLLILLQHFSRDIEGKILRVHDTSDKTEVIRNQLRAFVHDENAAGVQLKSLLIICGKIVERRSLRNKQKSIERRQTFHAVMNRSQRFVLSVEFLLIKARVLFIGDFALALLPQRDHAVERFNIFVCLELVFFSAFFLSALFHFHLNRISDVVGIFLD